MACKTQYGISIVCGDLLFPGGADAIFYVYYTDELSTPLSLLQTAAISNIPFAAYFGLRKFEGQKFSHKFGSEWAKGAGGNGFFKHSAAVKLISLSTQDDVEVTRLLQATNASILYKDNNGVYKILGAQNGLQSVAGPLQTTGVADSDDVSDMITLEGAEKTKPLIFDVGTPALTLNFINTHLI